MLPFYQTFEIGSYNCFLYIEYIILLEITQDQGNILGNIFRKSLGFFYAMIVLHYSV